MKFVSKGPPDNKLSIGSGNDLALNMQHTITWTNGDAVHWHIYAVRGSNKFSQHCNTENKTSSVHNFVVIDGTVSCLNDNLRCHQWRQSCQVDYLLFSVKKYDVSCTRFIRFIALWKDLSKQRRHMGSLVARQRWSRVNSLRPGNPFTNRP